MKTRPQRRLKIQHLLINKVSDIYSKASDEWLKFGDPPEGAHNGAGGAPVAVPPVLPGPQEVLPASVVGVLIEDPIAVHDITGVHVAVMETVRHTGTVIHELHHVTAEVRLLVDSQSVGASILWGQRGEVSAAKISKPRTNSALSSVYAPLTTGIILHERIQLLKPIHLW